MSFQYIPLCNPNPNGAGCLEHGPNCGKDGKGAGKIPLQSDWVTRGVPERPEKNAGILTGPRSGVLVIDVDTAEAAEVFASWGLPETYTVRSGRVDAVGAHYYFNWPDLVRVPDKLEGIEIKGPGRQVVAPGSMHRSGNKYELVQDIPPADLPGAFVARMSEAVTQKPRRDRTEEATPGGLEALDRILERLPEADEQSDGNLATICPAHNDHDPSLVLTASGDKVLMKCRAGCSTDAILDAIGLPVTALFAEAEEVVLVHETAAGEPVAIPAFPTDTLPPLLQELVLKGSKALFCPPEYLGASALAILGAALGRDVHVRITETWKERGAIWVAIVGNPGDAKSPAIGPLLAPVIEEQKRMRRQYEGAVARERELGKDGRPGEVPCDKVLVSDATIEALQRVLQDNPKGVLMHQDELSGWVRSLCAYKGGLGADRQHWLSIWSNNTTSIDRKGGSRGGMLLENPFVGIVGGIQPGVLHEIGAGREDGLVERFLFARGSSREVTGMIWDGLDADLLAKWAGLWRRLRSGNDLRSIVGMGREVTLDDEAKAVWEPWYVDVRNPKNVPESLHATWAKMPAQCMRIALILSQAGPDGAEPEVSADTLRRAIRLTEYFMGQARLLLTEVPRTVLEVEHSKRCEALREWLASHPGATRKDILQKGPRWARSAKSLGPVLEDLKEQGWVE